MNTMTAWMHLSIMTMAAVITVPCTNAFLSPAFSSPLVRVQRNLPTSTSEASKSCLLELNMNFFKDALGKAFENDARLDSDISKGQYDGPGGSLLDEEDDDNSFSSVGRLVNPPPQQLTETQQRWRQAQNMPVGGKSSSSGSTYTAAASTTSTLLANSKWTVDLFLTGIPARDPSNDLFASKTNISSRDRKVGLMVPEEPTVAGIGITLLEDGSVQLNSDSEFLDMENTESNQWKVSDDGSMIRICLNVLGYTRTVKTKGSIEKILWSNEDEKSVQTMSAYSIPPGPLYGDAKLEPGNQVGVFKWSDGVLRVEQAAGFLGAGSKMVPCGRFSVSRSD